MQKLLILLQKYLTNTNLKLLYLSIGFIFIIYVFYIRVLLIRIPRTLYMFDPINYSLIFIMIIWISLSVYIIVKSLSVLWNYNVRNNNFLSKIMQTIHNVLDSSIREVYGFPAKFISEDILFENICIIVRKFYDVFGKKPETIFLFITYFIKFIILLAFMYDICILFELRYFYKSLFLLIISTLIDVLFYILRDFAKNLEDLQSYLIIEQDKFDKETNEPSYIFKPAIGYEHIDLEYHVQHFILCSKINGYLEIYDDLNMYYTSHVNLIIYSMYLLGWLYILYTNVLILNII